MTTMTDIRTIGVTVRDQDAALDFYAGRSASRSASTRRSARPSAGSRSPPRGATTSLALTAGEPAGRTEPVSGSWPTPTPSTPPCGARRRGRAAAPWPGVPPMFEFDDPDGNRF